MYLNSQIKDLNSQIDFLDYIAAGAGLPSTVLQHLQAVRADEAQRVAQRERLETRMGRLKAEIKELQAHIVELDKKVRTVAALPATTQHGEFGPESRPSGIVCGI